jgi:HrpA-like RNA helicase
LKGYKPYIQASFNLIDELEKAMDEGNSEEREKKRGDVLVFLPGQVCVRIIGGEVAKSQL